MKHKIRKNIIIVFCLISFVLHTHSHCVQSIPHSEYSFYCICNDGHGCHNYISHNTDYNSHTFDLSLFDFSTKKIIDIATRDVVFNETESNIYCFHSIYLINNSLLI